MGKKVAKNIYVNIYINVYMQKCLGYMESMKKVSNIYKITKKLAYHYAILNKKDICINVFIENLYVSYILKLRKKKTDRNYERQKYEKNQTRLRANEKKYF